MITLNPYKEISKDVASGVLKEQMDLGETTSVKTGKGVAQGHCLSLILFNLYSEYLTRRAPKRFKDLKTRDPVIHTVKYVDDLVLLAEEEMVLQDMIERPVEIERC
jgi:hypothetical protein